MQLLNLRGRAAIRVGSQAAVDVATASKGAFGPDLGDVYERWADFSAWAATVSDASAVAYTDDEVGPPVPAPRQVFAVGLNYQEHADEGGLAAPSEPMIFTKFPASITGPFDDIELPSDSVDYETELVAVIGRRAYRVHEAQAWSYVAGLTCGQDISDRHLQLSGAAPQQFCLAKSFAGFSPIGPWLATADEFEDRDDVAISCLLNGQVMQSDRTKNMIFPIAEVVAYLSQILPLLPGDIIFTGTPPGIGWTRKPQVTLSAGDQLVTEVEGIGAMRNHFVASTQIKESAGA